MTLRSFPSPDQGAFPGVLHNCAGARVYVRASALSLRVLHCDAPEQVRIALVRRPLSFLQEASGARIGRLNGQVIVRQIDQLSHTDSASCARLMRGN